MATLTQDDVLDAIGGWTVLDLSEFVKAFEEKFGVTAAAPMAMAAATAGGGGGDGAGAAEEKDELDVVLTSDGDKKIQVIKAVRALASLGLTGAKDLVDFVAKAVLEGVNKEAVDEANAKLEGAGAGVEVKYFGEA